MITYSFSFFFPFLLVMYASQSIGKLLGKNLCGYRHTLILGTLSALTVVVPLGGIPLARWLISINANFSIPLTVLIFSKVWENALHIRLLDSKALLSSYIFGLMASLALYPMALGLGRFDPYSFGWSFSWLFVLLMVITFVLLFTKNRFGIVLAVSILCYDLQVLESTNLWDYLVDPFFSLTSSVVLCCWMIGKIYCRIKILPLLSRNK